MQVRYSEATLHHRQKKPKRRGFELASYLQKLIMHLSHLT